MKFLSDILAKAGLTVDGVVTLNNTATGQTPATNDNSTKLATTAFIKNQSYLSANQTITVSGDATGSGTTSIILTLANSGVTAGVYGNASNIPTITVDAKGRITSISTNAVSIITTLAGLSDVTLTSPSANQVLQYNGTQWVNGAAPTTYTLPIATSSILGGIKVGTGLSIDAATGILTVSGGGGNLNYRTIQEFTSTSGQTTYTISGGYAVGYVEVFVNGVYISENQYTATNGSTIVLTDPNTTGDVVTVFLYSLYNLGASIYARNVDTLTATAGQTSFTTSYIPGQIDVYYNGSKLTAAEYTATTGASIVLGQAAVSGDIIEVVTYLAGAGLNANRTLTINGTTYDLTANRTWTLTTANISEVTNLYYTDARARAAISVTGSGSYNSSTGVITVTGGVTSVNTLTGAVTLTTTNIAEGTNLYYTDARVGTYLTTNSYATQNYVGTQIANLVASAPATLDTLNELALALGNDPSFATTVATSIGTKVPQTRTITINGTAYDLSADRSWTIASGVTSFNTRTGAITAASGDYTTAQVTESGNLYYTDTRVRAAISLTTTGTSGAATYDSATGVINIPQYQGGVTSFNTRTGAITLSSSDVTTALTYTPVTNARTISINGTSYDLSANRSWTIAPDVSVRNTYAFTATAAQTTFTVSGGYTVGLVDVFINGVKLAAADFTATNGTTVVLGTGTGVGNIVEIVKYVSAFTTAVETTRTLTINGTTYDLSANRTWSIDNASLGAQAQLNGTGLVRMSGTTVSYDNATYATQSYVTTAVANLVNSAPSTLDTLNELATALGNDANFATTVTTSIGTKQPQLSGTGFVKISGTTISYDNSTYLTTASASSTYQTILTNPVTGTGTTNTLPKFTAASTIGNSNITDTGSLITLGSNSFVNGLFGVGSSPVGSSSNLYVANNITGGTSWNAVYLLSNVLSDVTSQARGFVSNIGTQAATFTLSNLTHYRSEQGTFRAGSTVTTQVGYLASDSLIGATNNYGFQGSIASGTNRWNIYMDGTANNYMAGSLGIGTTSFVSGGGTYNLNLAKSITGTVVAGAMNIGGLVQSDVTSAAIGLNVQVTTAAASFTLSQLRHISINQTTLGVGSSVSNQYGIYVDQITNGSNNFGFFGNVPAQSNTWNLYMSGTANNFLAGSLGIGSTSVDTTMLRISKAFTSTITAAIFLDSQASSTATNVNYINTSANTAAATFTVGAIRHISLTQGTFGAGSTVTDQYGVIVNSNFVGATNNYGFFGNIPSGTNRWNLYMGGTAANYMAGVLNIGTTTLSGYTLDVNGTARFTSDLRVSTGGKIYYETSGTGNSIYRDSATGNSIFTSPVDFKFTNATASTTYLTLTSSTGAATFSSSVQTTDLRYSGSGYLTYGTGTVGTETFIIRNGAASPALTIAYGGAATFSSSISAGTNFISVPNTDSISVGTSGAENAKYNYLGHSGYWGLKTTTTGFNFALDTYNGGTPKNVLTITQAGAATFSGQVLMSQSTYTMPALTASSFGYSSSYNVLILGNTSSAQSRSLAFNVDVSGNASGAFNGYGSEYIWRNAGSFITPNAPNTAYNTLLSWNSSGALTVNQAATFLSSVTAAGNFTTTADGGAGGLRLTLNNTGASEIQYALLSGGSAGTGVFGIRNGSVGVNLFTMTGTGIATFVNNVSIPKLNTNVIIGSSLVAGNIASNMPSAPAYILLVDLNVAAGFSLSGKVNAASYTCWNVSDVYIRKDYSSLSGQAVITGVAKSGCDFSVVDITYNSGRYIALRFTNNPEIDVLWTGYRLTDQISNGSFQVITSGVTVNSTYASY